MEAMATAEDISIYLQVSQYRSASDLGSKIIEREESFSVTSAR